MSEILAGESSTRDEISMLRIIALSLAAFISTNAQSSTYYQDIEKQRKTCAKMGEVAVVGYKYELEHGKLEAIIYISRKVVSMKGREVAEDEAQVYEAFSKGLKHGTRSAEEAYMAGWSWCMDGMQMK
jgi:hypothetical protein